MVKYITNPILRGFNPDPSILRVDTDYYIATSTFEWFPGVQIHHSKDLINWKLIAHPLNRYSHLDMKGNPNSGGVWAPDLSYNNGIFYLIYTDVKSLHSDFKDTHNYIVTSKDIFGEWSDPVFLNSSGFDPSLFHDEDGRKWLVNMLWDHRIGKNSFEGIALQEYCPVEHKLIGNAINIFEGTRLGSTEGPHIYIRNGYYYLLTAEGGTGREHAVTMARSKTLTGPYEVDPQNPILTSRNDPFLELQKAGHASIVQTQNGEWYMVHLCGRPLPYSGRCVLGRETSIQKVAWTKDNWLRLESGENKPIVKVPAPNIPEYRIEDKPALDDFDSEKLDINFSTLRIPLDKDSVSLNERPGFLRLKGHESLSSKHHQVLVARRQQSFHYTATTCIEFEPQSFRQMAGLICFYDTRNFYYLKVSHDKSLGKSLEILTCCNNVFGSPLKTCVSIEGWNQCFLKAEVNYDKLQFFYSSDNKEWLPIGGTLDASTLSDEYCNEGCFTGAFVGLCCQDLTGKRKHADFDFFEYKEIL